MLIFRETGGSHGCSFFRRLRGTKIRLFRHERSLSPRTIVVILGSMGRPKSPFHPTPIINSPVQEAQMRRPDCRARFSQVFQPIRRPPSDSPSLGSPPLYPRLHIYLYTFKMINTRACARASLRHVSKYRVADDWHYSRSIRAPRKRSSDNARPVLISARCPREHNSTDRSLACAHFVDNWSVLRNYRRSTDHASWT